MNIVYIVLKGKLENFLYSLNDMKERKSRLIKKYPEGTFIWGTNRLTSDLKKGVKVLFYVTGNNIESGIVFEGEILDIGELNEKYWHEGDWRYYISIKIKKIPKSLLESSLPSNWHYVTFKELKEIGFRPLPGHQRINDYLAEKIISLLDKYKF